MEIFLTLFLLHIIHFFSEIINFAINYYDYNQYYLIL